MYQAERRPWLRVRIEPPASSPASSFGDSLRLERRGAAWGGGVTSSLVRLLLLLRGDGSSGDSAGGGGAASSVLTTRGRPRRLGVEAAVESEGPVVSCEEAPPSSPVDWSGSSSGVELRWLSPFLRSSSSCLLFLPRFLPGGRPRGLEGLAGVATSGGLTGASTLDLRPLLPTPRVTWLLWPLRWTVF